MSTLSHPPTATDAERGWSTLLLRARDLWASLAICAMWIAVAVTSVWGPDAMFHANDGSASTIPSGIFVALFATIATWAVAKHVLRRSDT